MATDQACRLLMREYETHDVQRLIFSKPDSFHYLPGQGVEIALDQEEWRDQWRPFTPTTLIEDEVLQFIIKGYPDHDGVTKRLHALPVGERILVTEAFGTIQYRGPGVFIAGGAGITPFISIIRDLARRRDGGPHTLLFANKTDRDLICRNELGGFFGSRCHFVLSQEERPGLLHGRIDEAMLQACVDDFSQNFYVCGPPGFMDAVTEALHALGVGDEQMVVEEA